MTPSPVRTRMVRLFAVALLAIGSKASARDPQAAFALKGGWVECTVEHDDRPVANAALVILDGQGNKFADGETDETGQGQFPLPGGGSFSVEIKTGKKTWDPIRLVKVDKEIQPAKVLLSYQLRPCCRGLVKRDTSWKAAAPTVSPSDRLLLWVIGAAAACAVLGAIVFVRMPKREKFADSASS
ncbi:MAG: hypothetical protein FJ271_05335 [Planctomycetes bacterium]|nr:hypothetical protein [Planctomycetota bacterium]